VSARIETVLRRSGVNTRQHQIEAPDISFGELQINENTHEVRLAGELLDLTSKEFSLLSFIAATPRQVYTRAQLLEHVWASSSEWQNEATVTEHIRRLRAKIEADADHPKWIKTVRGVGYRFEPQIN
jgi:two-component system, OmpR family, phosphate regulon response regulator PhoB